MKRIMLLLLALAVALTAAAQRVIENPDIDYVPTWITLTEITLGNDRTVVKAELRNNPNPWVKVSSDTDLIDPATGNKYHILGAERIELDKKTYMPASGKMLCTLLFETVPASVERLNMVKEGNRSDNNIYGIHLAKSAPKVPAVGEDGIDPWTMTAEYYMSLPPSGAEVNIDYRRHRGMEFCKSATAHVKVHLDNYSPELGVTTVRLMSYDHVYHDETSVLADIGPDNTYEADIPIEYPQFILSSFPAKVWFLMPGDTLEVFHTINSDNTAFRSRGESGMINALNYPLHDRLNYTRGFERYKQMTDSIAAGRAATEALIDQLADRYNCVWDGTFAEQCLRDTPLSSFGKELVMVNVACELLEFMEDIYAEYNRQGEIKNKAEDGSTYYTTDPDFEMLDHKRMFNAIHDYCLFVYDNPLTLMSSRTLGIFNRSEFDPVFSKYSLFEYEYIARRLYGQQTEARTLLESKQRIDEQNMRDYGIGDCFMAEMARARSHITLILSPLYYSMDNLGDEAVNTILSTGYDFLTTIRNPYIMRKMVEEQMRVKDLIAERQAARQGESTATEKSEKKTPPTPAEEILQRIIEPYAGNLLYLDFWGMNCGPCRRSMIAQREIVEQLSGEPVRFLYICEEKTSPRKLAEQWMKEQSIKGEHIYLTVDEWNRLAQMFEISGIPHAVLVGRDGKVITNGFHLSSADDLRKHLK